MTHTSLPTNQDVELRHAIRRPLAIWSILGYPVGVLVLTQGPGLGSAPAVSAVLGVGLILSSLPAMFLVWRFRGQLAQGTDAQLDERQVAIRDRAYLESYRIFVAAVLVVLLVVGIGSDIVDRAVTLTFDTLNWYVMGVVLLSLVLPSAVVAWREPNLPADR